MVEGRVDDEENEEAMKVLLHNGRSSSSWVFFMFALIEFEPPRQGEISVQKVYRNQEEWKIKCG